MTVVATAGHVDHGKSSIIRALTGTDPDRLEEERRRGLTIDLGFAHTVVDGTVLSFVDVPGHVRFLRNMLAGINGVGACLFVVAATEGWKPQSEEHLRIVELLGVARGVVALTKVDLLDDEELVELAALEVADRLSGTFLAAVDVVPVAVPTDRGVDELGHRLAALVASTPPSIDRQRPRLWIDRVFAATGRGTVVTGTLTDGGLAVADHVVVVPGGVRARVRGIQTLGQPVDSVAPGHRVALNLAGAERVELARGDAVVTADRWHLTDRIDASLTVLAALDHEVSRRGAYLAHIGSGEHAVRVRVLGAGELAPGATGAVRLHLPVPLPLLPGDRFVLRESGRDETVGGGEVLDVEPVLSASKARPDRRVERVVAERGWVDVDELERLTGERSAPTIGRWVIDDATLASADAELRAAVDAAGPAGFDPAGLDGWQRVVFDRIDDIEVVAGRARLAGAADPLIEHPVLERLRVSGMSPPDVGDVEPATRHALARRGDLVVRDDTWFHRDALDAAAGAAALLLDADAGGFTVAQFRDATGTTRKHAVPLLVELDARGVTRRRGDVRIAGPMLPPR
ncbi:MAG: selenocysteine-specific translation elongation factor [Acidimicrobiia bacterium]|nr:selenocysteine-specific translation elongation factor [Acidimicrobiia bacterium]